MFKIQNEVIAIENIFFFLIKFVFSFHEINLNILVKVCLLWQQNTSTYTVNSTIIL